ncbi:hypothetical protein [Piscirickettsia salmonis]|nr:hypothetical protein [Piscirickettsia salmonis]
MRFVFFRSKLRGIRPLAIDIFFHNHITITSVILFLLDCSKK